MSTTGEKPISQMHVLVADDNRDAANSLADLLQLEFGCRTSVAFDGAQALRLSFAENPDVIVLDIRMPGMGGIEVATRIRASGADQGAAARPLLFGVTGQEITRELASIDGSFDGAFAKPIDIERMFADLKRHWHGQPARAIDAPFDVFGCFARAVREVLPLMAGRGQTVSFDCQDEPLWVQGDEVALRSAMYRLMAGLADAMGPGSVWLAAQARTDDAGRTLLTMSAAGCGTAAPAARIEQVLARLSLAAEPVEPALANPTRSARGACPICGGSAVYSSSPAEGSRFRLEVECTPVGRAAPLAHAAGASAWVIEAGDPRSSVLERRLQRFGWRVCRLANCADALALLAAEHPIAAPTLVVVREGPGMSVPGCPEPAPSFVEGGEYRSAQHEGTPVSAALCSELQRRLAPHATVLVLAAAGSAVLADAARLSLAARVEPLSAADLGRLTEHALLAARVDGTDPASAWSKPFQQRSRVLVVDDSEVNRIVASGLVRALGYDAFFACDGLDAIEQCKASPPDIVLMDVSMPVLGGIDATRHLRELQRSGRVAPFAIVAATADADDATARACREAGMDGFLTKPLLLPTMHDELRRVARYSD